MYFSFAFYINNIYTNKVNFLSNSFTPLINIFVSKSRTLRQQLVLHILCKPFVQWHPVNAQNLQSFHV